MQEILGLTEYEAGTDTIGVVDVVVAAITKIVDIAKVVTAVGVDRPCPIVIA